MKMGNRSRRTRATFLAAALATFGLVGAAEAMNPPRLGGTAKATTAQKRTAEVDLWSVARARLAANDRAGALAALEKQVVRHRDDVSAWTLVGDLRFSFEKVEPALDAWSRAASLQPWNDAVLERVARGSVRLGDWSRAAEAEGALVDRLEQLLRSSSERREVTTGQVVSVEVSYREHLANLAELHALAGDFTSAEQAARRLLKHAPQGLEGKLALAYVHLHGAEHDEAESLYQDVLERDPSNPTALNNLGNILYMRRDFEGAGRLFDQILSNEAAGVVSRSIALSNLAELYQIEGDTDSARDLYADAIEQLPRGAWGHMGLAGLLDLMGEYDAATDAMIDGWERDQNQLNRMNMHFYTPEWLWQRDALIAEIEGDHALAVALWTKVLQGEVTALHESATWHLRDLAASAP